jgi:hypothetical protein
MATLGSAPDLFRGYSAAIRGVFGGCSPEGGSEGKSGNLFTERVSQMLRPGRSRRSRGLTPSENGSEYTDQDDYDGRWRRSRGRVGAEVFAGLGLSLAAPGLRLPP